MKRMRLRVRWLIVVTVLCSPIVTACFAQTPPVQIITRVIERHGGKDAEFFPTGRAIRIPSGQSTCPGADYATFDAEPLFAAVSDARVVSVPVPRPFSKMRVLDTYGLNLQIAKGIAPDISVRGMSMDQFSQGASIAMRAILREEKHMRWQCDDGIAPWLGSYLGAGGFFAIGRGAHYDGISGIPTYCDHAVVRALANDAGVRITCGGRRAVVRAGADGAQVDGNLISPGPYREITRRMYERLLRNGWRPHQPLPPNP